MCYRLELTARRPSDLMIAIAKIRVLSNLELWIGIVVACLPTMKPFVDLSKLSHKLHGSSAVSTKDESPQLQLRTFGGFGPSRPKNHSNYTERSEAPSVQTITNELHLVPFEASDFDANCELSNTRTVSDSQGIFVSLSNPIKDCIDTKKEKIVHQTEGSNWLRTSNTFDDETLASQSTELRARIVTVELFAGKGHFVVLSGMLISSNA
ncbi:hypothetical protein BPOR_0091g00040 [Botrytis porri]|uniref:Uncharacterized protein n=1 Tax=Botrytis porri TaxID=87229 RepID=A0A4Z1KZ87_9HELO|nr:hypothetical protein BPOR_0091g00040 [Botrytis porri]